MIKYFEISIYLFTVLAIASFFVALKFKRFLIVPIISLIVFSSYSIYIGLTENAGWAGLIGWTVMFTICITLPSLFLWFLNKYKAENK